MVRRVKGGCRGRGNASADNSDEAVGVSTRSGSKSKEKKEIAKNVTEENKGKMKNKKESKAATPSRTKRPKEKKKVDIDGDKKSADELEEYASSNKELCGKTQEVISKIPDDGLKMESFVDTDIEKLVDSKRKIKGRKDSKVSNPAVTPSRIKVLKDKKKVNIKVENSTDVEKACNKLAKSASTKKELGGKKQKGFFDNSADILKTESLVSAGIEGYEKCSSNPVNLTDKAFLACASPLPAGFHDLPPISECLQGLKLKAIGGLIRSMVSSETEENKEEIKHLGDFLPPLQDSEDTDKNKLYSDIKLSKLKQELYSENKKKVTEGKIPVGEIASVLQCSQDIDEQKLNLDVKASKVPQVFSSSKRRRLSEPIFKVEEFIPTLQYSKITEERKLSLDVKSSKNHHELSSENGKKRIELKTEGNEFPPLLQSSKDFEERKENFYQKSTKVQEFSSKTEKNELKLKAGTGKPPSQCLKDRKLNLDKKAFKVQQVSSVKEVKITDSITDGNKSTINLHYSKDIEEPALNLDLKTSIAHDFSFGNKKEAAESKLEVDEYTTLFQDSKLKDIKDKIQSLDINASNSQHVVSSENQNKMNETEIKEKEEIINLRRDVNLRFEFDNSGNTKAFVGDKDQYTGDGNRKISFITEDGNLQLSYFDNKVCIFTQKGDIDCSIQKSRMVFSLADSATLSNSPQEGPSINELSQCKDAEVARDLGNTKLAAVSKKGSFAQYEKIHHETLKTDATLVSNSAALKHLQSITDIFLAEVKASCNKYEIDYIECLNEIKYANTKR